MYELAFVLKRSIPGANYRPPSFYSLLPCYLFFSVFNSDPMSPFRLLYPLSILPLLITVLVTVPPVRTKKV